MPTASTSHFPDWPGKTAAQWSVEANGTPPIVADEQGSNFPLLAAGSYHQYGNFSSLGINLNRGIYGPPTVIPSSGIVKFWMAIFLMLSYIARRMIALLMLNKQDDCAN